MAEKGASDEFNDLKFAQYVKRVNDAVRKIILERKDIVYRSSLGHGLSVDQVFSD